MGPHFLHTFYVEYQGKLFYGHSRIVIFMEQRWSISGHRALSIVVVTALLGMMGCNGLQENNYEADRLPACAGQRPTDSPAYLLFFDQHSEVVNPRQLPIVKEFVSSLSDYRDLAIGVVASTDTSEVLLRDQNLDLRRGQAVERLLREEGIAADAKIRIFPEGAKRLFVPTPPLTAEPQNRNVWLHIQDGKRVRPTYWQADCIDWLRTHRCDPQVSAEQAAVCKQVEKVAQEFQP